MTSNPPIPDTEMISFLNDPASFPHQPKTASVIQTHISWLAIVPPYVYKVKKTVDLGFLDFSSLAQRRHFCEEEVRLNRRLCQDVYDGVVAISRTDHGLALECDSNPVEFAVKMKLLKDGSFLHQLIERDPAPDKLLERVSEHLARFYRHQRSSPRIAEWGKIDRLQISTNENFEQIEPFVGSLITAPALSTIRQFTNDFFRTQDVLLNRRRAEGHILDGHGDLRLEHIHVTENAVSVFDCIEFSERLRYIDPANDLAFLAMDLEDRNHRDLATLFIQHMARQLADPDLHKLMDFYKCYRACVRGKVEGIRSQEPAGNEDERHGFKDRAVRFFQLALNYAVAGAAPMVLVIMGRIGSGKSAVAELLSDALGWSIESSDRTRKRLAKHRDNRGADHPELYGETMTGMTYDELIHKAKAHADKGHNCILDATFGSRKNRDQLREVLQTNGVPYCFIELKAPESTLKQRLGKRDDATARASDARLRDFDRINSFYNELDALEDAHHREVNAEGPAEATAHQVLRHLAAFKESGSPTCVHDT
jgi:uncharacterized protein